MQALLLSAGDAEPVQETIDYAPGGPQTAPLISCLMVTRGTVAPARFAIECFQRQTYANRELVIVCDETGKALQAYLGLLGDGRIRYIDSEPASLGTLRNLAVAEARGEIVAQWDDDDLYHPDRLSVQMAALADGRVRAVMLQRWMMWWPARRRLAVSARRLWEGSLLAWRDAVAEYPALSRGEDTAMIKVMRQQVDLRALDSPRAYLYIAHARNTFGEAHMAGLFNGATEDLLEAGYDDALTRLSEALPIRDYLAALR